MVCHDLIPHEHDHTIVETFHPSHQKPHTHHQYNHNLPHDHQHHDHKHQDHNPSDTDQPEKDPFHQHFFGSEEFMLVRFNVNERDQVTAQVFFPDLYLLKAIIHPVPKILPPFTEQTFILQDAGGRSISLRAPPVLC
jgi:hypothetical protein